MSMKRPIYVGIVAVFFGAFASTAAASITVFTSAMDGAQANAGAGTGSPGIGSATMTLDSDTNEFSWFISWDGLTGIVINAHFHGPATPDQDAGVQVGIDFSNNPALGSTILTNQQVADLFAGLWYINIHSTVEPNGEIRGQVLLVADDSDGDGVADSEDNCTLIANADQRDSNGDDIGNACDADLDNNCVINFADLGIMKSVFFTPDADADLDGNGVVNFTDLGLMKAAFFGPPGPSASGCDNDPS